MYVIVVYDIEESRVNKVRKILRKYLKWVQNSVFEGEIGIGTLAACKKELKEVIEKDVDSIYIYKVKHKKLIDKEIMGTDKDDVDFFI